MRVRQNGTDTSTLVARRSRLVRPFLKWPGGKRWLVPVIVNRIAGYGYTTYREPFLGGGALFFALQPKRAVLSDINTDLINTYRQIRRRAAALIYALQLIPVDQPTYHRIRTWSPDTVFQKAVRFLYLNRTAFGGMYRVNAKGDFNVPFGGGQRTAAPLWDSNLLQCAARVLRKTTLVAMDFESALSEAQAGDLVYCDPTYTVAHNNNGFIRYNEHNFSWTDQQRLAVSCRSAAARGALVIVSNAFHDDVLRLFEPPEYISISRISTLCPEIQHRHLVDEYMFVYPPKYATPKRRTSSLGPS
jgi:DNA adenine methylase